MYQLVRDLGDPNSENKPELLVKSNFNTLKEAKAQAEHDIEMGYVVVGIMKDQQKMDLKATSPAKRKKAFVWTPSDEK